MATRTSPRFFLFWSVLAAAGGCGQILGISDYEVDPKLGGSAAGEGGNGDGDAGSNTGGKAGHAGTASAGSSAGGQPGGNAGAGGEPDPNASGAGAGGAAAGSTSAGAAGAGTAGAGTGTAGVGGEAGAGGAPPAAKFKGCDGTPFEGNEAIIRSCILRVGCQIWNYPNDTISRCVSQNTQNTYEGTKCTLDAETCADITACEGTRIEKTFCDDKEDGQYCNGNEVVTCGDYPYARDCTKDGGTCKDFGVPLGTSEDTVDCALSAVTACTATTDEAQCGGAANAYKYQCQGTIAYGSKCSNFAASCQDIDGDVACYYPLNSCDDEGVSCANDRATWCDGESKAVFDCGSVGLGCATEGDYYADNGRQCAAPGCTPTDVLACEESCQGTNLTFCYGGAPVTVDCRSYGFTKCAKYSFECGEFSSNDCLYTSDTVFYAECE